MPTLTPIAQTPFVYYTSVGVGVGVSVGWSVGVSVTATLTPALSLYIKKFRAIRSSLSSQ